MPRKNRKARTQQQRPHRSYHPGPSRPHEIDDGLPLTHAAAADPDDESDSETEERDRTPRCGTCREWVPAAAAEMLDDRGRCLHPGSGFAYPPADMPACPFYHR